MSTPTIPAGNLFMNATLFTATGTTQTVQNGVAGQSFQPDFVWQKARNQAYDHLLVDSVRGASKYLVSDSTAVEQTQAQFLTSFNSDGFSLGTSNTPNGTTMVGWQWKAGGTAVSNTAGSLTSQVSVNATAGFSIVTFTTGNTASPSYATVGHGLSVAPTIVILKNRTNNSQWPMYSSLFATPATQWLQLNTTTAIQTASPFWGTGGVTSTTIGLSDNVVQNNCNFVAYCWAPIAGYSAFGSYTGNGSTDGPFIYLGFRPKFVMYKVTSTASSWLIQDTSRQTYNVMNTTLAPNSSGAENGDTGGTPIDFLSNGFKLRSGNVNDANGTGQTYIYAAFAENPFKYANAR